MAVVREITRQAPHRVDKLGLYVTGVNTVEPLTKDERRKTKEESDVR